jgi:hypothetical protein
VNIVTGRVRFVAVLVGLLAIVGAAGVQGPLAAGSLVLALTEEGNLEVVLASGVRVRTSTAPGVVIAPGSYQAVVISQVPEARDSYHMFHLVGPGVNLQTDLLAGDERAEPHSIVLQPNATYTFTDDRNSGAGRVVFSTSGPGTEAAATSSSSSSGTSSGGKTISQGTVKNMDAVGSNVASFRGTLSGGVSTTGKLTLSFNGKKVSSLKAGRYTVKVLDETASSAFTLQRLGKAAVTVSGKAFVGKRTLSLTLRAGQWFYYPSSGAKSYFIVVAR